MHTCLQAFISIYRCANSFPVYRSSPVCSVQAARGELEFEGLKDLASSIDVSEAGVGGAKGFFEAQAAKQSQSSKFVRQLSGTARKSHWEPPLPLSKPVRYLLD